jgi:hypothetical protein
MESDANGTRLSYVSQRIKVPIIETIARKRQSDSLIIRRNWPKKETETQLKRRDERLTEIGLIGFTRMVRQFESIKRSVK